MEHFIIYLIKASGLLAVFYIAYHTLLRKETFFYSNRKFLLAGLITSAVFPLLILTRTVWIESVPQAPVEMQDIDIAQLMIMEQKMHADTAKSIDWYSIAGGFYIAGVLLFLIRFGLDIKAIIKMLRGKTAVYSNGFKYIDSETVQSPFSFFNYIVYNSKILSDRELHNILSHEKVHSAQKHSFDMIISQLFCITFWFNPFVWAYRKAVSQNLEFIADAEAAKEIEDITSYQKTLLKITVQPECTAIINHFYQSLIKKRIVMLNKKQSKTRNSWKYAVVVPALVAFMFCFQLKVIAQEKTTEVETVELTSVKVALEVTKDTKDEALESEKAFFKQEFDTDITFSDITRNEKGEITGIKVVAKNSDGTSVYESSGKTAIAPFIIEIEKDDNGSQKVSFGVTPGIKAANVNLHQNEDNVIIGTKDKEIIISDSSASKITTRASSITTKNTYPAPAQEGNWSVNNIAIDNKDLLIVINGVKQEKGESIKLPLNMEIDKINFLDKKDAKKKYGKDGKKGAVEITTKKDTDLRIGVIIKSDLNGSMTEDLKNYTGEDVIVIDEKGYKEGTYDRTNNILITTEQQLNDSEEILLKCSPKEQEEKRRAMNEERKEIRRNPQDAIMINGNHPSLDLSHLKIKKLTIYDHYGTQVYEKESYKDEWHGQSDKGELSAGTYFYIAKLSSGKTATGYIYLQK